MLQQSAHRVQPTTTGQIKESPMTHKNLLRNFAILLAAIATALSSGCGADLTTTPPFPMICEITKVSIRKPAWDCSSQPGYEGKIKSFRCVYPEADADLSSTSCTVKCQNNRIIQNVQPSPVGVTGEVMGSTMGDAGTPVQIKCYPNAL